MGIGSYILACIKNNKKICVRYEPHGEKQEKTASLKHRINGKQKKNTRPTARKIVKCKEKVRLPWKKIKNDPLAELI